MAVCTTIVAATATALSLFPAITAPDRAATKAVLVGAHLVAAAVIIPILSQRLPQRHAAIHDGVNQC